MIVKFFTKRSKGKASSCKACVDYLLKKPDDTAKILQGDPRLSQAIADSLDFNNTYTAGCLSFEEVNLPEQSKREIMIRFEKAMFAGLESEQYNISWVQHTDKGRLELNFVIPNVELTSQKRLQPYYDKADRPLVENFKQIINHEYNLSDPNDPRKQQVMLTKQELPKEKKQALLAITDGLTALAKTGKINDRTDVINALENAGFEIARITPKNISIKTDGQNLRLKGAFYEQDFRFSDNLSENIAERTREYQRNSAERYQTSREKLDRAITARQQEFSQKYPNRASEIDKKYRKNVSFTNHYRPDNTSLEYSLHRDFDMESGEFLSRDDRMGAFSRSSQRTERLDKTLNVSDQQRAQTLHSSGQRFDELNLGRQFESDRSTRNKKQKEKINGDRNRTLFRESLERLVATTRERAESLIGQIKELTSRKRIDTATIQRNQQSIRELTKFNQSLEQTITRKAQEQRLRSRSYGMSL